MQLLSAIKNHLFFLLIFLLPFNLRHIFNFEQIKHIEGFREHLAWSLYGFDFILGFLVIIYLLLFFKAYAKNPTNVLSKTIQFFSGKAAYPILFGLSILLAAYFSSQSNIAFYNSIHLIKALLFFLIAKDVLKIKKHYQPSLLIIFLAGILQSIIAIGQFITQKSLGLRWLGESPINNQLWDVAKIEIHGEKFLRSYGTFPHPNLLGAFLLMSLICGWWILRSIKYQELSIKHKTLIFGGLFINLVGIFLTFSRSIWLVTFLSIFVFFLSSFSIKALKKIQITNYKLLITVSTIILLFLYSLSPLISSRFCLTSCPNDQAYSLRKTYNLAALKVIKNHSLIGVGPGNFIPGARAMHELSLPAWQQQPVHNLYLLIASEIGILGLIAFILILLAELPITNYQFLTNKPAPILFFAYLFLGLFDHYFWTLPQGQLIFWLSLALIIRFKDTAIDKGF